MKQLKMKLIMMIGQILGLMILVILLVGLVRTDRDLEYFQENFDTRVGGPFEASNSTSRYALTIAMVRDKSMNLDENLARFASPDVVEAHGKFLSIFTPGVSWLAMPLYILGEKWSYPQWGAYSTNMVLMVLNMYLVGVLARKLGAGKWAAVLAALTFGFATNALVYSLTLTQHMASTAVLLLMALNLFKPRRLVSDVEMGLLAGAGLLMDLPNVLLMLPLLMLALSSHVETVASRYTVKVRLKLVSVVLVVAGIPGLVALGWYNQETAGSYTAIAQMLGRTSKFNVQEPVNPEVVDQPVVRTEKKLHLPFDSRLQLEGLYILLVSNQRGWLWYSPVVILGAWGLVIAYRKAGKGKRHLWAGVVGMSGVILMDVVVYSMFGDPWGGWSYGPRYLIPGAAMLSAGIGVIMTRYRKWWMNLVFLGLFGYSSAVNLLGATTTASIPPKGEALHLVTPVPYTYKYSWQYLETKGVNSLGYWLLPEGRVKPVEFVEGYWAVVMVMGLLLVVGNWRGKDE